MIVYTAAGLTFTIAVGLLIIGAFQGVDINLRTDRTKGIAEIASGIVALAFALGVLTRRIGGAHADDAPKAGGRWDKLREHRLTLRTAALAGPATHIPGLFYLIALNVIVAHQPKVPARRDYGPHLQRHLVHDPARRARGLRRQRSRARL